jgi:hypothetical protein
VFKADLAQVLHWGEADVAAEPFLQRTETAAGDLCEAGGGEWVVGMGVHGVDGAVHRHGAPGVGGRYARWLAGTLGDIGRRLGGVGWRGVYPICTGEAPNLA